MQSPWQQFLVEQGAHYDHDGSLSMDNSLASITQLEQHGIIASLDYLGCIRASGDDARNFLQGQLSNDITQLQDQHVQFSAYCNPKGRMLAQFLIFPDGSDYLLLLPRAILEPTLKRLRMFVLRSQVTLSDESDQLVCLGMAGNELPGEIDQPLPAEDYELTRKNQVLIGKLPAPVPRYLLLAPLASAKQIWQALSGALLPTDQHAWHWLDIQAGLPTIQPQTVEEFVPQMVNLELINAVNFKKGCYPGQEIVARMHYLGKPKRRMHRFSLQLTTPPAPGTDIYVADGNGQSAGKVVLAEQTSAGCDGLAVILTDKLATDLRLGTADGPKLMLASLPYTLESA